MTSHKITSTIISVLFVLLFIFYAIFAGSGISSDMSKYFSYSEDERTFHIFGENITINEKAADTAEYLIEKNSEINSMIFPDVLIYPIKAASESFLQNIKSAASGFHEFFGELLRGSM